MSLDPILTIEKIKEQYKNYLNAQFSFNDNELNSAAQEAILNESKLFNGPYIEASMPYETGRTLEEMVNGDDLNRNIYRAFSHDEYSVYKRYKHQEKAILAVNSGRNIVVASGTGSGKTECFIIPIINELLCELDRGELTPGVRALIVYPMNALANDQMDRLRIALKNIPEIKFARYIGETENEDRNKAVEKYESNHNGEKPLENELLTRKEIHDNPPHILITNYAMLEYMLLRPEVNSVFQGGYAQNYKYIVLDEAHTYRGSHGTEISMLLRRLKERIFGQTEDCIQCIATSATLGDREDDLEDVAKFASQLFSEKFYKEDIILSKRDKIIRGENKNYNFTIYKELLDGFNRSDLTIIEKLTGESNGDINLDLYNFCINDRLIYDLRVLITREVLTLNQICEKLFDVISNEYIGVLSNIIELGSKVKSPTNGLPLINSKYHFFVRALEGGFVSFYPQKKLFTERKKTYQDSPVYEIKNCYKCGQAYIIGRIDYDEDGDRVLLPESTDSRYVNTFMVCSSSLNKWVETDDEELEIRESLQDDNNLYLCPKCGKVYDLDSINCCGVNLIRLVCSLNSSSCLCCRSNTHTVRKMITGDDSSTEVITRTVYQMLSENNKEDDTDWFSDVFASSDNNNLIDCDDKAKLLVFSDNRQEAAKFTIFLQNRYNDFLWKRLIWDCCKDLEEDKGKNFDDLKKSLVNKARKYNLYYDNESDEYNYAETQIIKELVEFEPRMSLIGTGLLNVAIDTSGLPDYFFDKIKKFGFTLGESKEIFIELLNTLRRQFAISCPDDIDVKDEAFAPKNRIYTFKRQGGDSISNDEKVIGFIPSNGRSNVRLDYLKRIFIRRGQNKEDAFNNALNLLGDIYFDNFELGFCRLGIFEKYKSTYRLNYKKWLFYKNNKPLYRCNKCGCFSTINISGVCKNIDCDGYLQGVTNFNSKEDYYRNLFTTNKIVSMNVEEHTAQLTNDYATEIQNKFKNNEINVLSCSTTFEMGVDIGSLESILLRNVPPEASNYIQRAGRAGRRNSSSALIVTFARRRSHDLTYFENPIKMIKGDIRPPYINLENIYIVKRHLQAVIMSYFFLNYKDYYNYRISGLFNDQLQDINIVLYNLLRNIPKELENSIQKIIPSQLINNKEIKLSNWIDSFVNIKDGIVDIAVNSYKEELKELNVMLDTSVKQQYYKKSDYIKKLIKTHTEQETISYLSKNSIIPRYGFPVDTVPLIARDNSSLSNNIDLSRDLSMAITEYAPGTEVVAGKKIWRPYALKTQVNKKWPVVAFAICSVCGQIHTYNTALGSIDNRDDKCCDKSLKYKKIVKPIFGFTTKETCSKGIKFEKKYYNSISYFDGFNDDKNVIINNVKLGGFEVKTYCAPNGKMMVVNTGSYGHEKFGMGFSICPDCGFMSTENRSGAHERYNGGKCNCKLEYAYLGHDFLTDVLVIELPFIQGVKIEPYSLLYSIIEGASNVLDIDRRELSGTIISSTIGIKIALFDTVPGGVGHVRKIQENIETVLESAKERVSGKCGCDEDTSCYGCLRNYDNQIYHEEMSRGIAYKYWSELII